MNLLMHKRDDVAVGIGNALLLTVALAVSGAAIYLIAWTIFNWSER